jgi:hypothetical protein
MFEDGPLRWLLIPSRPETDKAFYLPHSEHFGDLEMSQFCVRYISKVPVYHDIDLKGMSPWDYLRLGLPRDIPIYCPFPPDAYFWDMTHDEDHILHGGPSVLDNLVFSQVLLDQEREMEQFLLEEIEDLQELIESGQATRSDEQDLRKYKLRITRLTKTVWLDSHHDGSNCTLQ